MKIFWICNHLQKLWLIEGAVAAPAQ